MHNDDQMLQGSRSSGEGLQHTSRKKYCDTADEMISFPGISVKQLER